MNTNVGSGVLLRRMVERGTEAIRLILMRLREAPDLLLDAVILVTVTGWLALLPTWWSWLLTAVVLITWLAQVHRRRA